MKIQSLLLLAAALLPAMVVSSAAASSAPILALDAERPMTPGEPVTVPLLFDHGNHVITAVVISLDIDSSRLTFDPTDDDLDGIPDAITLPQGVPAITVINHDPDDPDGELDILLSTFSSQPLPEGVLLEVELVPSSGGWAASWMRFSDDPSASFGNDLGQDVEGTTAVLGVEIFADGFESGELMAWSRVLP